MEDLQCQHPLGSHRGCRLGGPAAKEGAVACESWSALRAVVAAQKEHSKTRGHMLEGQRWRCRGDVTSLFNTQKKRCYHTQGAAMLTCCKHCSLGDRQQQYRMAHSMMGKETTAFPLALLNPKVRLPCSAMKLSYCLSSCSVTYLDLLLRFRADPLDGQRQQHDSTGGTETWRTC